MDPSHVLVDSFASHEKRIVLQPVPAVLAKGVEVATVGLGSVREESMSGFAKECLFEFDYAVVRNILVRKARCIVEVLRGQKAFLTKSFQIDEQRVPGECRK